MKPTCPHCFSELDAEASAPPAGSAFVECPACSGRIPAEHFRGLENPSSLAVARVKTEEEIAAEAAAAMDTEESSSAPLRLWRGVHRNIRILGAAAILILGGVVAFLAMRRGGNTYQNHQPPFPRPPVRSNGSFRGLPQKATS